MIKNIQINTQLIFLFFAVLFSEVSGFSYESIHHHNFTSIHILIVDPKEHLIIPVKAQGKEEARETVLSLAKQYGAVAAVNGGFWKEEGKPAGILKINSQWLGTPIKPRGAIGWTFDGTHVLIDRVLTSEDLDRCQDNRKITVVPVSDLAHTTPQEWQDLDHIVGGTPVLVSQGNIVEDYSVEQTLESFLIKRHPRTAVGIKENGEWVFAVVDGRFFNLWGGMTIKEMATLMQQLGCVNALNLDGGGSSTMIMNGSIINRPCGRIKEEGKKVEIVCDAILILPLSKF